MPIPKQTLKALDRLHEGFTVLYGDQACELEKGEVRQIKEGLLAGELDTKVSTNKLDIVLVQLEQSYLLAKEKQIGNLDGIIEVLDALVDRFIKFYEGRHANALGTLAYRDNGTSYESSKTADVQEYSNRVRVSKYASRIVIYKTIKERIKLLPN